MCVPMTAMQFGGSRGIEVALGGAKRGAGDDKTETGTGASTELGKRVAAGCLAGAASGVIINPFELTMIQQQKYGGSLVATTARLMSAHGTGIALHGAGGTAAREALYTCGYLCVLPVLRERLQAARPDLLHASPAGVAVATAVAVGLTASVMTQPFDTVKTLMQSNIESGCRGSGAPVGKSGAGGLAVGRSRSVYRGYWSAATNLVASEGAGALWRGLLPRSARVVGATFILSYVNERAGELIVCWRGCGGEHRRDET